MNKKDIDTNMFAPCGMNCKVCYKHCNSKEMCPGCLYDNLEKPKHCQKCKIKNCLKDKNFKYCFKCSNYPCKLIKNLDKSYRKNYKVSLIENSNFVKNNGLKPFMEKEKSKYICIKCGGIISIHDGKCSECQEKVK